MLPIVRRELQVAARKPGTYRQRLLIGGAAVFLAFVFFLFDVIPPNQAGAAMFKTLMWAAFVITFLDGIRCSSDSISWERREGTLGLLFLTDLRGYEVVLGKLSAAAIRALSTTIVTLPVFALPVLVGGITAGESARVMLTLVVTVLFSLAAGLFVSAICTSGIAALIGAALPASAIMMIPALIAEFTPANVIWLSGPLGMLLTANDLTYHNTGGFWPSLLASLIGSLGLLMGAGFIASRPGSFEANWGSEPKWKKFFSAQGGYTETWDGSSPKSEPAVWLAERTLPGRRALWILVGAGALICLLIGMFAEKREVTFTVGTLVVVFGFLAKLWMGAISPQSLHHSRKSGALELLLCTPLRSAAIITGQISTQFAYILPIAITLYIGFPILAVIGSALGGGFSGDDGELALFVIGLIGLFIFLLDVRALTYAGLWFGLTSPRIEQAMGKTIGCVLLLPWLTALVPCVGMFGFILWPIFWIIWFSNKLNQRFTSTITEQFRTEQ